MDGLGRWLREKDWSLIAIVAAFIALIPLYTFWQRPLSGLAKSLDTSASALAYERAIRTTAVKTTANERAEVLEIIDPTASEVEVATLALVPPSNPLAADTWVALPAELKGKCAGKPEPARALQEILGLPRRSDPGSVYRMTVMKDDKTGKLPIFRPCMSSPDTAAKNCTLEFPPLPDPAQVTDQQKAEAFDELWAIAFVARQMWNSYRLDFPRPGYPFTGLGWSYNWDPETDGHVGISEFIVRKGAKVKGKIEAMTPSKFCGP